MLATTKYLTDTTPYDHVKCLQTDNGTEFGSEPFQQLFVLIRIKHEQSSPYSLHQNGTTERLWQTLFSMARFLFIESKLLKNLWVYALMALVYIRNCYTKNTRKIPYESFTSSKPNLNKMHIFGTTSFYVQNKTKLDPCCEKGMINKVRLA